MSGRIVIAIGLVLAAVAAWRGMSVREARAVVEAAAVRESTGPWRLSLSLTNYCRTPIEVHLLDRC
jgi:hypothetical protein